jgi:hypothetical protein
MGIALMEWEDRIDNYVRVTRFPRSLFISEDRRVVGTWIMGNDYRVKSAYYGGYPAGYLRRIRSLFPDKKRVLHLFSGKVDLTALPGDTVDINPALNPTYVGDAQTLEHVPLETYDLVLADPPYSVEDAERYQTTMIKRNAALRALQRLGPGTHIVWLDQVLPMYRKDAFAQEAVIGMVKSTNHRFRVITIFRRRLEGLRGLGRTRPEHRRRAHMASTAPSATCRRAVTHDREPTLDGGPVSDASGSSPPMWASS